MLRLRALARFLYVVLPLFLACTVDGECIEIRRTRGGLPCNQAAIGAEWALLSHALAIANNADCKGIT